MTEEAARAQAPVTAEFSAARKIDKRSEGRVELGTAVPSAYLHRDLGVWSFFERKRTSRGFSYDPCRILELLVWDRIAHPSSKRAAWEARARFPRKCGFTADDVYRCLTYLDENADALVVCFVKQIFRKSSSNSFGSQHESFSDFTKGCGTYPSFLFPSMSESVTRRLSPLNSTSLPWCTILSTSADASLSSANTVPHFPNSMLVVSTIDWRS